ncbi:MAG: nuclear transport factor 2 family protein [Solirubrobacteraceae bacterium]
MVGESAELVRRAVEAFNRAARDGRPDSWLSLYDAEFEGEELERFPHLRRVSGHDGLRSWFGGIIERFGTLSVEVEDAVSTGPDEVITAEHWVSAGSAGGGGLDVSVFCLITAREGRIASRHVFPTREEALAAAVGERAPGAMSYD